MARGLNDADAVVMGPSRDGLARSLPGSAPEVVALRFVALHDGRQLADGVRADLEERRR